MKKGQKAMTVKGLVNLSGFSPIFVDDEDREISGAYVGDLLSWVMGRAKANDAWITIMSNLNVVAVATLADVSCVIFAEGVLPEAEVIEVARSKGVSLISSSLSAYETAVRISEFL